MTKPLSGEKQLAINKNIAVPHLMWPVAKSDGLLIKGGVGHDA